MARPRKTVPAYRKHKQTGRAAVSIYRADGSRSEIILPGAYGSEQSKQEYERLLCQLRANDGKLSRTPNPRTSPGRSLSLVRAYGNALVREFDSLCLEAVQTAMASDSTLTEDKRHKKIKRNRPLGCASAGFAGNPEFGAMPYRNDNFRWPHVASISSRPREISKKRPGTI